jgi:hypothetical protein
MDEDRDRLVPEEDEQGDADPDAGDELAGDPDIDGVAQQRQPDGVDPREGRHHDQREEEAAGCARRTHAEQLTEETTTGVRGGGKHDHERPEVGPARPPAVGSAEQAAGPLVDPPGDRPVRREAGVDEGDEELPGHDDGEAPHPRRASGGRAEGHDRVQPDDRRDEREADSPVGPEVEHPWQLLAISEVRQALLVTGSLPATGRLQGLGPPGSSAATARRVPPAAHAGAAATLSSVASGSPSASRTSSLSSRSCSAS